MCITFVLFIFDSHGSMTESAAIEKIDPGNFDFAEYINQYSGQPKVDRCKYVAERCPALAVRSACV
jgi:hypothetical protein